MAKPTLEYYLNKIEKLAFRRTKSLGPVVRQLHALLEIPKHERDAEWINLFLAWMIVPYTLWPGDFKNFAEHVCNDLVEGKELSAQAKRILRNFRQLPSQRLMTVVAEDEHEVMVGNYDQFLTPRALRKYAAAEAILLANPEVHERVAEFFRNYPEFGVGKVVMRRRLTKERNFRVHDFAYDPNNPENIAQLEFDSICFCFQLFGVERLPDGSYKPLLQKLSVNTTPHGISIFIPRYWSLDAGRDIKWDEINKIQRAWGNKRQGEKWSETRVINHENAKAVYFAARRAAELGLKGDRRWEYICKAAKLSPLTPRRTLERLLKLGRELCESPKANSKQS